MADTKISALPAATTPLAGTEVIPIVQSGVTKKVSIDNLTTDGTWTPSDQSGAGLTLIFPAGNYTKIGRLVFVTFQFTYPATADGTVARIALPFAAASGQDAQGGFITITTLGALPTLFATSGAANFRFAKTTDAFYTNAELSEKLMRGTLIYNV